MQHDSTADAILAQIPDAELNALAASLARVLISAARKDLDAGLTADEIAARWLAPEPER